MESPEQLPLSILVVDDEPELGAALSTVLGARGHHVTLATTGSQALGSLSAHEYDAMVLDLSLPDISGLDVLRVARETTAVPILILSVNDRERDKITALDLGADDYLTKPFSTGEMLARLRAIVRRRSESEAAVPPRRIEVGDIVIDDDAHQVWIAGEQVKLTKREYDILRYLARNAGRVLTYDSISQGVWGAAGAVEHQVIRVHLSNLRRKVEDVPAAPRRIVTEPGVGIRLAV